MVGNSGGVLPYVGIGPLPNLHSFHHRVAVEAIVDDTLHRLVLQHGHAERLEDTLLHAIQLVLDVQVGPGQGSLDDFGVVLPDGEVVVSDLAFAALGRVLKETPQTNNEANLLLNNCFVSPFFF